MMIAAVVEPTRHRLFRRPSEKIVLSKAIDDSAGLDKLVTAVAGRYPATVEVSEQVAVRSFADPTLRRVWIGVDAEGRPIWQIRVSDLGESPSWRR